MVVVAALALIGFGALIAMLRGGSGQPQPIARTAPGPDPRRVQTQPRVSTPQGFDPRHGQSGSKVSTVPRSDQPRGQLQKKAETASLSDEDRFRGRWEQVGTLETNQAPAAIVAAADTAEQTIKKRDGTRRSEPPGRNPPPAGHHIVNTVWVFRASSLTLQGMVGRQNKTLFHGSHLWHTAVRACRSTSAVWTRMEARSNGAASTSSTAISSKSAGGTATTRSTA